MTVPCSSRRCVWSVWRVDIEVATKSGERSSDEIQGKEATMEVAGERRRKE
nr:hypothetical protein Itr_chr05CG11300 [Ipomoea trifida]